ESGIGVDEVLMLSPGVLVTEATPSDLSCCGIITQLNATKSSQTLRVVMIVRGGALERARALDLGADDGISSPFDAQEFAARIRTQVREREPERRPKAELKAAEPKEKLATTAVEVLAGGTATTSRRKWILPLLLTLSVTAVLATVLTVVSTRKGRKDTLQLRAELARLNRGIIQQSELLELAGKSRDANQKAQGALRESLQAQYDDLQKKLGSADAGSSDALRSQLKETQSRLAQLESEGKI